jgi:hypothetical protein
VRTTAFPKYFSETPQTAQEIDRLTDALEKQAKDSGFAVKAGASNVSGSRYVTITKDLPDDEIYSVQVRISNHGDKYPGNLDVASKRFSIDPDTGNTLQDALQFLEDEGFAIRKTKKREKKLTDNELAKKYGITSTITPIKLSNKNFKNWFGDSKVVDSKGKPLVVYHGTGNLEGIKSFDPASTGQGLDQLGSGFYFTTNAEEASGYSTRVTQQAGPGAKKLGGNGSPGVVAAYLSIKNPLKIKGSSLRDANINISSDQAFEILKNSPDIKNMENTPLWNWIDLSGSDEIDRKSVV